MRTNCWREMHMADVEHSIAVYWDEFGSRKQIKFKELEDDATYTDAQQKELFDESEQVRVNVRVSSKGLRHFYSESSGLRSFDRGENNPAHDNRVGEIRNRLLTLTGGWSIAFQYAANTPQTVLFNQLPAYSWDTEVTRILDSSTLVRHDVYGDIGIRMSVRKPSLAIEVVHSHYPEEASFAGMISETRRIPSIILFDFTRAGSNSLIKIDEKSQTLLFRSYTFSISDGSVWQGLERRPEITTSADLQVAADNVYEKWKR